MALPPDDTRRRFLGRLSVGIAGIWTLLGGVLAGVAIFGPVGRAKATRRVSLGDAERFGPEYKAVRVSVPSSHGWLAHNVTSTVFVRVAPDGSFEALSGTCTHLGCTVRWNADAHQFQCPCHGGRFDADGRQVEGPPPRPLTKFAVQVSGDEAFVELS